MGEISKKVIISLLVAVMALALGGAIASSFGSTDPGVVQARSEYTTTETKKETIAFDTETVNDGTVEYGKTVVKTEGVNGEKTYTYSVTYKDDKEISRELVKEEVTKQPITKVIANGTKIVWSCKDATSYDKNPNNDNLCTSSTGESRYVDDCTAVSLAPGYRPSQKGASYYNGCAG